MRETKEVMRLWMRTEVGWGLWEGQTRSMLDLLTRVEPSVWMEKMATMDARDLVLRRILVLELLSFLMFEINLDLIVCNMHR